MRRCDAARSSGVLALVHRLSVLLVVVALAGACRKDGGGTAAPVSISSESFKDTVGEIQIDVGYRAKAGREVQVVVNMKAIGIEEMDKIVLDVTVNGFVLVAGEPEWSGFVAPRQPIRHEVGFKLLDDTEHGELHVTVRRSNDSELLYERVLPFVADGDRLAHESQ